MRRRLTRGRTLTNVAHAVVATFDSGADAEVRALWAALANSKIDSSMMTLGVAPHLTLAVMTDTMPGPLIGRVGDLARRTNPFGISFDRIDMFQDRRSVPYLAPRASTAASTDVRIRWPVRNDCGTSNWVIHTMGSG